MLGELDRDEYGFLKHRSQWSEQVAEALALEDGLALSTAHWEIIRFMQGYYDEYNHQPNARLFGQAIKKSLGADKGSSICLYKLFPEGPLKYANKYAGLPIPPSCI
ncbi:MAG TPA: TusE/DsrC/DsvC family sulfur relay protein [Cycloclasticus sp.]|jgi:tRNA 2-thiouridine synthesizing protein E|nr:TusE/DsrC/DsvC family sulfur relay protein [Cycloclasticus sp.]HIL92996.1 TusE/DsrC/DsvC family sulfur relay protein [Cycloclasticus sp.]